MARLRDYTQSLMNPESDIERDEEGNLTIRQVQDVDPYQAGIQAQESMPAPPDPNAKPIFMTNIPEGGFGPSYENPGGVPGSDQDRAQMEEQAKAAGSELIDLSEKKKMPSKPPDYMNPEVDLNAPGERDKFRQGFIEDVFNGVDLPRLNIQQEMARSNLDPVIDKKAWSEKFDRLTKEVAAARALEDRIIGEFDKNAAIQAAVRKRKTEAEKATGADLQKRKDKYLSLGEQYTKTLDSKQKLLASLDTTFDETAKDAINAQIQELDNFANDIKYQMKGLENTPGVKPYKPGSDKLVASHKQTGATKPGDAVTPKQKNMQAFFADKKAKGVDFKTALEDWAKQNGPATAPTKPAQKTSAPAKIVKPAPAQIMPKPPAGPVQSIQSIGPRPSRPAAQSADSMSVELPGVARVDIDSMKSLAEEVGLGAGNWKAAAKLAADAAGVTVELLYLKPLAEIKRLLQAAVSSQSKTRKQMGL